MRTTLILLLILNIAYLSSQTHNINQLASLSEGDLEEDNFVEVE